MNVDNPEQVAAQGLAHLLALCELAAEPTALERAEGRGHPTPRAVAVMELLGDEPRMLEAATAMLLLENQAYAALMRARLQCSQVEQLTKSLRQGSKALKKEQRRAATQTQASNREAGETHVKPDQPYLVDLVGFNGWFLRLPSNEWSAVSDRMLPNAFGLAWPKVNRMKPGPNDSEVAMKSVEIAELHGGRIAEVIWTMHGESRFVEGAEGSAGILYQRCCPLDPLLRAEFDQEVSDWLALLGGSEGERLLDWLATCTDLSRPTCALYVRGPKSVGKGMLAAALSRLWGQSKTTYADVVFTGFTSALRSCPIVHVDEQLPKDLNGRGSAAFRTLVGESTHPFSEKGRPTATLCGCPRCVITTNNHDALRLADEDLTREDQEAIAERVLYILADPTAADLLTRAGTADWVNDGDEPGRICRHIMWLVANWKVKHPGDRFLVQGHGSEWVRQVGWQGTPNSVLVAAVRSLSGGESEWDANDRAFTLCPGGVHVRTELLHSRWRELAMSDRAPPLNSLGRSIGRISPDKKASQVVIGDIRCRAWFVPNDTLLSYAETSGIGDLDRIKARLGILAGATP